mmetsp:Transcript_41651/g.90785  ORF Transcript_41651/g.90785 Transcript_41651/m.90785 type:complete len:129 (-) Transcript_41651:241-627(-)
MAVPTVEKNNGVRKSAAAVASSVVPHGHGHGMSVWQFLLHLFCKLRCLGLVGYGLEWILELSHANHKVHRRIRRYTGPKFRLLAMSMVLAGHLAEHIHQEEENHEQEDRIKALELRLAGHTDEKICLH